MGIDFPNPSDRPPFNKGEWVPEGWKPLHTPLSVKRKIFEMIAAQKQKADNNEARRNAAAQRLEEKNNRRARLQKEMEEIAQEIEKQKQRSEKLTQEKHEVFSRLKIVTQKSDDLRKRLEESQSAQSGSASAYMNNFDISNIQLERTDPVVKPGLPSLIPQETLIRNEVLQLHQIQQQQQQQQQQRLDQQKLIQVQQQLEQQQQRIQAEAQARLRAMQEAAVASTSGMAMPGTSLPFNRPATAHPAHLVTDRRTPFNNDEITILAVTSRPSTSYDHMMVNQERVKEEIPDPSYEYNLALHNEKKRKMPILMEDLDKRPRRK